MDWNTVFKSAKRKVSAKNLMSATGFFFAGVLWGLQIYNGIILQGENLFSPFVYMMGAIYFAILGSIFFFFFSRSAIDGSDIKKIISKNLKEIFYSLIFWVVIFLLANIFSPQLFLAGKISRTLSRMFFISDNLLEKWINIPPLMIGDLWLAFFFISFFSIIFYGKLMDQKTDLRYSLFPVLSVFLCPIIPNIFKNEMLGILICFGIISFTIGLSIKLSFKENENRLF